MRYCDQLIHNNVHDIKSYIYSSNDANFYATIFFMLQVFVDKTMLGSDYLYKDTLPVVMMSILSLIVFSMQQKTFTN